MKTLTNKALLLGKNIEKAMKQAKITPEELSLKTGIDKTTLENILEGSEDAVNNADSASIIKIASVLKIEETVLFDF